MTNHSTFLIDTNSFITPSSMYYPFDIAPSFWAQMEDYMRSGDIVLLDLVRNEVLKGADSLSEWIRTIDVRTINHQEPAIIIQYSQVLQFIQDQRVYKQSALQEWSRADVADAWIIASAKVYGHTIVTFETANSNLSERQPSKEAKIPDVAAHFGVHVVNLYEMMRILEFRLG